MNSYLNRADLISGLGRWRMFQTGCFSRGCVLRERSHPLGIMLCKKRATHLGFYGLGCIPDVLFVGNYSFAFTGSGPITPILTVLAPRCDNRKSMRFSPGIVSRVMSMHLLSQVALSLVLNS